jgi:hypothetical protein
MPDSLPPSLAMSFFPSYSATPGLERFPLEDRKRVYWETLIKLRKDDPEFARRADRSSRIAHWITGGFIIGAAVLNGLEQRMILSVSVYLPLLSALLLVYLVALFKAVRKHQQFLNERIAAALPDFKNGG